MISIQKIIIIYLLVINVLSYALMCYDKYQSRKKGGRISENTLFMLALVLGSVGIYSGMKYPMYHKAAKSKFKWGIPFMIIVNFIFVYFLLKFITL